MRILGERADGAVYVSMGGGIALVLKDDRVTRPLDDTVVETMGPWRRAADDNDHDVRRAMQRALDRAQHAPLSHFLLADEPKEGEAVLLDKDEHGYGSDPLDERGTPGAVAPKEGVLTRIKKGIGKKIADVKAGYAKFEEARKSGVLEDAYAPRAAAKRDATAAREKLKRDREFGLADDQPRDEQGRFAATPGGGRSAKTAPAPLDHWDAPEPQADFNGNEVGVHRRHDGGFVVTRSWDLEQNGGRDAFGEPIDDGGRTPNVEHHEVIRADTEETATEVAARLAYEDHFTLPKGAVLIDDAPSDLKEEIERRIKRPRLDNASKFAALLASTTTAKTLTLSDKHEHPFTWCKEHVIPAMEREGKAPDDPDAFCAFWKAEHT